MRPSPQQPPFFVTPLYPTRSLDQDRSVGRVVIRTSWQRHRAGDPERVDGNPWLHPSLLELETQYYSVLPFGFRRVHRIWTRPLQETAPSWRGVSCTLEQARIWLPSTTEPVLLLLPLVVLCPIAVVSGEPLYPLIGNEFLRRHAPTIHIDFVRFPWPLAMALDQPIGEMSWP